jgi:hypothetical protein
MLPTTHLDLCNVESVQASRSHFLTLSFLYFRGFVPFASVP